MLGQQVHRELSWVPFPTIRGIDRSSQTGLNWAVRAANAVTLRGAISLPDKASPACVLVADDDVDMREWLREALEGAGYDVLEAANGKEAIRLLKEAKVDLFITDLFMPEQGIETIRILRHEYPSLRVIAMSGAFGEAFYE